MCWNHMYRFFHALESHVMELVESHVAVGRSRNKSLIAAIQAR